MDNIEIEANPRTLRGKRVKAMRRAGLLPAIMYGKGLEPKMLELPAHETEKILQKVSGSTLIDLKVGNNTHKALVREIQREVISRKPIHVDFLEVAMDVVISAVVPIELVGEAPAVRDLGGVLLAGLNEIEVEALPANLPERITVDISVLLTIEDSITVGDLTIGEGVTVLTEPDEVIANVAYQAVEEEPEVEVELLDDMEPELVERAGQDDEDGESDSSKE
jgi:large subunit ribosomal protein L25